MVRVTLILLLLFGWQQPAHAEQTAMLKGVNVLYYGSDGHDKQAIATMLDYLSGLGVDTILLTIPVYIDGWSGNEIGLVSEPTTLLPQADSPNKQELQAIIQPALERGMQVFLRPLLDEGNLARTGTSDAWRGTIQPPMPEAFFANYQAMLEQLVQDGQGVSWLVLGSEMNTLEQVAFEPYWVGMLDHLRMMPEAQSLKLSYAQNWDTGMYLGYPSWLSLLDGLAIDAYFPIQGADDSASAETIWQGMTTWQDELQELRNQNPDKPLFITEVGLASQSSIPSVLQAPWSWPDTSAPANLDVQSRYVQGVCSYYQTAQATAGDALVHGLFWWATRVHPPDHPEQDRSFEFVGKPAAQAIQDCYS